MPILSCVEHNTHKSVEHFSHREALPRLRTKLSWLSVRGSTSPVVQLNRILETWTIDNLWYGHHKKLKAKGKAAIRDPSIEKLVNVMPVMIDHIHNPILLTSRYTLFSSMHTMAVN